MTNLSHAPTATKKGAPGEGALDTAHHGHHYIAAVPGKPAFSLYESVTHTARTKGLDLAEVVGMARNPSVGPKKHAKAITPFDSTGKTSEHALAATFWAVVKDHDDDDLSFAEINDIYGAMGCAYLLFSSSSHMQEKGGVAASRWKVIIPLSKGVDADTHHALSLGAALASGTDKAQARQQQVFYAPNKVTADAEFDFADHTDLPPLDPEGDLARSWIARHEAELEREEQVAQRAPAKPRDVSGMDAGIIDKINGAYSLRELLESSGYRQRGKRLLSPYSSTDEPGVMILERDGKEVLYSHHGESDPLSNLNHGGHTLDVFDVVCAIKYSGDVASAVAGEAPIVDPQGQKQRQREYMKARDVLSHSGGVPNDTALVSDDARRMAEEIRRVVAEALQLSEDDEGKLVVDPEPLDGMMKGCFWMPTGSKFWHVTQRGDLVQHTTDDAWGQLETTFGKAVDDAIIMELVRLVDTGHKEGTKAEEEARQKLAKECRSVVRQKMMFYLKRYNQRVRVSRYVDMFADRAQMILEPENVVIIQTHRPFALGGYDMAVIEDYKQHFPRFDELLKFLAAARFAPDRKKAYLWMRLLSDWGKDFLLDGVLGRDGLGLVASLSEAEIEKMFEGAPVGRDPVEFLHAWVLLVNEFKKVNGEMKQLERSVRLAPKHQLTSEVPVYAKIFTSAEGVASLAGDNGVEDQFANRFSVFEEGAGKIIDRDLFNDDPEHYLGSLRAYAAEILNSEVERYRAMGEKGSKNAAKRHLDEFHRQYGIAEIHGRLDDRIPEIAVEIRAWLLSEEQMFNRDILVEGKRRVIVRPSTHVERWISDHISRSEQRTISLKREAIYKAMSLDGKGQGRPYINGRQVRGILLSE